MTHFPLEGSLPLGAHCEDDGVRFSAWSDRGERVALVLYDSGQEIELEPLGDGLFSRFVPGLSAGARYDFKIGDQIAVDPYARSLPHGVLGPAAVAPELPLDSIPKRHIDLERGEVLYELHIGTFTPQGTFESAARRLRHLKELGVTVIELMPIAAFAGNRGWGYDGVGLFAPLAAYGTLAELRTFIDQAHELELSVLLDVVYNHLGPAGNFLPLFSDNYFDRTRHTAWGNAPALDRTPFRRLVLDNARHWLAAVGFDGLRLDATHELEPGGEPHILCALADVAHACTPKAILIAEDNRNDPSTLFALGVDGVWSDDFHHVAHVLLTHETDGYYAGYEGALAELAQVSERGQLHEGQLNRSGQTRGQPARGVPLSRFVFALQNHDQVGNRAHGERLQALAGIEPLQATSLLLLFLPATPLLFMGEEWAASTPFLYFTNHDEPLGSAVSAGRIREFSHFSSFKHEDSQAIPNPQHSDTFERSKLRWDEAHLGEHARSLALYRRAIELRRGDPVLREPGDLRVVTFSGMLCALRKNEHGARALILNLGAPQALSELHGHRPEDARLLLSTHPAPANSGLFEFPANSASIYSLKSREDRP